jgi:hypothetical protein
VLDHLAAIFFFSGPLFYIGLWMALDPASCAGVLELAVRVPRSIVQGLAGVPARQVVKPEEAIVSNRLRPALRLTGLALVLWPVLEILVMIVLLPGA